MTCDKLNAVVNRLTEDMLRKSEVVGLGYWSVRGESPKPIECAVMHPRRTEKINASLQHR